MYLERAPSKRIDRYAGPYERWVFSDELGRPYAFPAISEENSVYFTALLEGGDQFPNDPDLIIRKPPLWNPLNRTPSVTPFAFHDATTNARRSARAQDTSIADMLGKVRSTPQSGSVKPRFRVNFPIAPEAWSPDYTPNCDMEDWVVPSTRPKAIIGVIDDGIPFAHRAFLDGDGKTRISHIWLQSAEADTHSAVPFGRELMNGNINALRAASGDDEDLLYRMSGAIDPAISELGAHLRRHATHGSHVAGMCAGNDMRVSSHEMGDDVQIIAVQLPNTIAWDTSGFGKEMYMLSALHYIFNRARAIAEKYSTDPDNPEELPLVVNFSYGWSASRHDGKSEMELAIQELLEDRKSLQPKTAVVMPTGNNFAHAMHGQITSADIATGSYAFEWKLLPDDRTSSYLEIWLPEGMDPDGYTVSVTPPPGYSLTAGGVIDISADEMLDDDTDIKGRGDPRRFTELEMQGENIGQLSVDLHRGSRWRVMVALIPTISTRGQSRRAPSGNWRIEVHQNSGVPLAENQQINVWVHRDDDPAMLNTGGRQSRLVDLNDTENDRPKHPLRQYSETLGFIRGYGGMNGVASSPDVTRIAGYTASSGKVSWYSGASGLTLKGDGSTGHWGAATSYAAVSDKSQLLAGTASIGVRSGSGTHLSGTSGASPAASRIMVLNAAEGADFTAQMSGPLPLPHTETSGPVTLEKHIARAGTLTVPHVTRSKPARSVPVA